MTARFSVFAQDRSERWILVPGVASARQIEMRNDSDAQVECHLRVEQPPSASPSPAVLTIQPHHARSADIIFLANWSPERETSLVVSLRDPQGEQLAVFTHELVAADSSDCAVGLDLKEPVLVDGVLAGFKLWFTITSKSATPRRFEIDFVPHPSLRFPERTTVTLAPGEATAFEVPVEWNRSVRDVHFWNHPLKIEAFVPASHGRRTTALSWETIERRLNKYLTEDDKVARMAPLQTAESPAPASALKTPDQLRYTELVELKKLEQAVVGAAPTRTSVKPPDTGVAKPETTRFSLPTLATTGFALLALAVAAFLYLPRPVAQPATAPVRVTPPELPTPVLTIRNQAAPKHIAAVGPVAKPVWTSVSSSEHSTIVGVDSSKEAATVAPQAPKAVALAPVTKAVPHQKRTDRNAIVALTGVDAAYISGGHAVSVAWTGTAQASATVQVLDFTGRIIASRSVRGDRSTATIRLPRGYHGSVSVQVIAFGYHGERVVQSASLVPGG